MDAKPLEISSTTTEPSSTTEHLFKANGSILESGLFQFGVLDYAFFVLLISLSALIGIYYGFFSKHKQNTTAEYILGGRSMQIIPVATSMIATHISGSTLVGLPAEIYSNGTQYIVFIVAAISVGLALSYIYLPLFHNLQVTSSFEYLERRFNRRIRLLASTVYTILHITITPITIFVPALAFSQVSGINLHFITPVICIVCIFYTTIGGLRAVVWTDFIQFILMLAAIIAVIVLGVDEAGGFSNVWTAAERGQRLIVFNMDPSPFARTSFWAMTFGLTVLWLSSLGVGQTTIQRFLSVPDLRAGRRSVMYFVGGMIFIKLLAIFIGLCIYAKFEHCDPMLSGVISKPDEIVLLYVGQVGQKIPGLPGLFTAGIFAAGLSTMSSSLNSLSGTIYEDFIKKPKHTEREASNMMKWLSILLGVIVTALVFVVESLGSIFQISVSISGVTAGAFLAIFTIGMTSRTANSKGLIAGVVSSVLLVSTMLVGGQLYDISKASTLPVQTDGCSVQLLKNVIQNTTTSHDQVTNDAQPQDDIFWLFRISFMYYAVIGITVTIAVSHVVSLLTGGAKQHVDESLLTPLFQSQKYKEQQQRKRNETKYVTIDQMLIELKKNQKNHQIEIENDVIKEEKSP